VVPRGRTTLVLLEKNRSSEPGRSCLTPRNHPLWLFTFRRESRTVATRRRHGSSPIQKPGRKLGSRRDAASRASNGLLFPDLAGGALRQLHSQSAAAAVNPSGDLLIYEPHSDPLYNPRDGTVSPIGTAPYRGGAYQGEAQIQRERVAMWRVY